MKTPRNAVSEQVHRVRGNDGKVQEVVGWEIETVGKPVGHARVDLMTDRGRLLQSQLTDNFVSRLWAYSARSWNRLMWSSAPLNEVPLGVDQIASGAAGRLAWHYPQQYLAVWNDATAEAPTTEHRVKTDSTGLLAYASRHPVGSPAGARGSVNVTDSTWLEDGEEMVYDWPTSAGNGTFQSVGYIAAYEYPAQLTNHAVPALRASWIDRKYYYYSGDIHTLSGLTSGLFGQAGLDASGNWVMLGRSQSANNLACLRIPAANFNTGITLDSFGAGEVDISGSITAVWSNATPGGTVTNTTWPNFVGEYGGYYWAMLRGTSGYANLCRINKTTGALDNQVPVSLVNAPGFGTIIGSNAFVCGGEANPPIVRLDLTGTPPPISATITVNWPSYWTAGTVTSMCTDGTDLYLMHQYGGVVRVNTSGTIQEFLGHSSPLAAYENNSAPYSGNKLTPGNQQYEGLYYVKAYGGGTGAYATAIASGSAGAMFPYRRANNGNIFIGYQGGNINGGSYLAWIDGKLQMAMSPMRISSSEAVVVGHAEMGWNLGTRALLGSPVTKTSSNTMKLTYQIDLPQVVA